MDVRRWALAVAYVLPLSGQAAPAQTQSQIDNVERAGATLDDPIEEDTRPPWPILLLILATGSDLSFVSESGGDLPVDSETMSADPSELSSASAAVAGRPEPGGSVADANLRRLTSIRVQPRRRPPNVR